MGTRSTSGNVSSIARWCFVRQRTNRETSVASGSRSVVVLEWNKPIGYLNERNIARPLAILHASDRIDDVREILNKVKKVGPGSSILKVGRVMSKHKAAVMAVIQRGKLFGTVTRNDIIKFLGFILSYWIAKPQ